MTLIQARLTELYDYDPATGALINKASGYVVGSNRRNKKYAEIHIDGRTYKAHRCAWLFVHGVWPKDQLDHINRDTGDNRIANLRECDNSQNAANRGVQARTQTGAKGISLSPFGVYRAYTKYQGKKVDLGSFRSLEDAVVIRNLVTTAIFGEFAKDVAPSKGRRR